MDSKTDNLPRPQATPFRRALVPSNGNGQPLSEEEIRASVADLDIEDGEPVESVLIEKQQRLLTEPLYCSWTGPGGGRPFFATANVGLFFRQGEAPLAPDMVLSLDVPPDADLSEKANRSYFVWIIGKVPEVVIEIVSDRRGGEDSHKRTAYARMGVPYYVIFDPEEHLGAGVLRVLELRQGSYQPLAPMWFPEVGLGLQLWAGSFEGRQKTWLRWCYGNGQLLPTGRERAELERRDKEAAVARADLERQRADVLAARLRALGIYPDEG